MLKQKVLKGSDSLCKTLCELEKTRDGTILLNKILINIDILW